MDATQGKSQDTGDIDDSGTEAVRQKSCGGWDLKDRLPFSSTWICCPWEV